MTSNPTKTKVDTTGKPLPLCSTAGCPRAVRRCRANRGAVLCGACSVKSQKLCIEPGCGRPVRAKALLVRKIRRCKACHNDTAAAGRRLASAGPWARFQVEALDAEAKRAAELACDAAENPVATLADAANVRCLAQAAERACARAAQARWAYVRNAEAARADRAGRLSQARAQRRLAALQNEVGRLQAELQQLRRQVLQEAELRARRAGEEPPATLAQAIGPAIERVRARMQAEPEGSAERARAHEDLRALEALRATL